MLDVLIDAVPKLRANAGTKNDQMVDKPGEGKCVVFVV